jgi:hypothetical protein
LRPIPELVSKKKIKRKKETESQRLRELQKNCTTER